MYAKRGKYGNAEQNCLNVQDCSKHNKVNNFENTVFFLEVPYSLDCNLCAHFINKDRVEWSQNENDPLKDPGSIPSTEGTIL